MSITAIVICHKLEHLVDRAVASIVTQTRRPDQVILLGTDCRVQTYDHLEHWLKVLPSSARLLMTEAPLTCAQSKNYGSRHVETEAFFTLDADDWIHPNFVQKLGWYLDHGNADVIGCDYQSMDEHGFVRPSRFNDAPIADLTQFNVLPSCSLIRTKAFNEVGPYDEDITFEDWALWVRMFYAGKNLVRYPQVLYTYVQHATQKTKTDNAELGALQIKALVRFLSQAPSTGCNASANQAHSADAEADQLET